MSVTEHSGSRTLKICVITAGVVSMGKWSKVTSDDLVLGSMIKKCTIFSSNLISKVCLCFKFKSPQITLLLFVPGIKILTESILSFFITPWYFKASKNISDGKVAAPSPLKITLATFSSYVGHKSSGTGTTNDVGSLLMMSGV